MRTVEAPKEDGASFKNGSGTGCIGMLQRGEIDVDSYGRGMRNNPMVDYISPAYRVPRVMIANRPEGAAPNMWVYLRIFGLTQWSIYVASLVLIAIGLFFINIVNSEKTSISFGSKRGHQHQYELYTPISYISLVYLYTIQMGSHTTANQAAARIISLTLSILAFLMFAFYTTDITAKMTSGPPEIPIKNFGDVVHFNYKVITYSTFIENLLASSKPGSAKREVYDNHFEMKKDLDEIVSEMIRNPKRSLELLDQPEFLQVSS